MVSMVDESKRGVFHTCNFSFSTRWTSQFVPPANESSAVADYNQFQAGQGVRPAGLPVLLLICALEVEAKP